MKNPNTRRPHRAVGALAALLLSAGACADVIPIADLRASGQATVTGYASDIGGVDQLFDRDWNSLCRSAAVNPVSVTVQFVARTAAGATRVRFNAGDTYRWSLEAADTLADLNARSGTFVTVLAPVEEVAAADFQWREFNRTPVTRKVWRWTAERLTRDDYVHWYEVELQSPEAETTVVVGGRTVRISELEVAPGTARWPVGSTQQFSATGSLCLGRDRYDLTGAADWSSSNPAAATVQDGPSGGLAQGVGPGSATITAAVGPVVGAASAIVRAVRPVDLCVGYIHRTPEYERFRVDFTNDQRIEPGTEDRPMWPGPGQPVTYRAKVMNKGDLPSAAVAYRWYFDDEPVAEGVLPAMSAGEAREIALVRPWPADEVRTVSIPPGAQQLHPKQLERALQGGEGGHRVRFVVDPGDQQPEGSELNNAVEDYIGAVSFRFFMERATYDEFNQTLNAVETYSAEDWARAQLRGLQRRMSTSGIRQKIRLTELVVVPDGALDPGGTHEPRTGVDWLADSRWGFVWPAWYVARYAKSVENALVHELGHQMGLIDVYNEDVATDNCLIRRDGVRVAGTALMPPVSPWNVYYGDQVLTYAGGVAYVDTTRRDVMAGPGERYFGPVNIAGMNRNVGMRRGFFGDYLSAITQEGVRVRVRHADGAPVAGCAIRVFQREYVNGQVPDAPKFTGAADAQGLWTFPAVTSPLWTLGAVAVNNPWSHVRNGQPYRGPEAVGGNVPLVFELRWGVGAAARTEYHFRETTDLNVAMAEGRTGAFTIDLVTFDSRRANRHPVIGVSDPRSPIDLAEGQEFQMTVTAQDADGDPVVLGATPLDNTSFDPATGIFRFRPDSMNVNLLPGGDVEQQGVVFTASDGKITVNRRVEFRVRDVPGFALLRDQGPLTPCRADFNADGFLDFFDYADFVACFEGDCPPGASADFNRDGFADFFDYLDFVTAFERGC